MPAARRSRRSRKRREKILIRTIWASLAILCLCLVFNGGRPKKVRETATVKSEPPPSNITIPVDCTDKTSIIKAELKNLTSAYNTLVIQTQQTARQIETLEADRWMSRNILFGVSLLVLVFATIYAYCVCALVRLKREKQEIALRLNESIANQKGILALVHLNGSYRSVAARAEALQRDNESLARKAAGLQEVQNENREKLESIDALKRQLDEQVQDLEQKSKEVDRLEESKKVLEFEVRHFSTLAEENIELKNQVAKLEGAQEENTRLKAQSDHLWAIQMDNWARAAELQMREEKVEKARTAAREREEELKRAESKLAQEVNAVREAEKRLEGLKSIAATLPMLLEEEKRLKEQVEATEQLSSRNREAAWKLQDSVEQMAEESRMLDELQHAVNAKSHQLELKRSEYEAARMCLEDKKAHLGSLDELQAEIDQMQQQTEAFEESEIDELIDELVDDLNDDLPENEAVTTVAPESVKTAEMGLNGDDQEEEPEDSVHDTMVTAEDPAEPCLEAEQLTGDRAAKTLPLPIEESQVTACEPEQVTLEVDDPQDEPEDSMHDALDTTKDSDEDHLPNEQLAGDGVEKALPQPIEESQLASSEPEQGTLEVDNPEEGTEDSMGNIMDIEKESGESHPQKELLSGDPIEEALAQPADESQFQYSKAEETDLEIDDPQDEPEDCMGDTVDDEKLPGEAYLRKEGLTGDGVAKALAQPINESQFQYSKADVNLEVDSPQEEPKDSMGDIMDIEKESGESHPQKKLLSGDPVAKALAQPIDESQSTSSEPEQVTFNMDVQDEEPEDCMVDMRETGKDPGSSKVHDAGLTGGQSAKELAQPIAGSQLKSCKAEHAAAEENPPQEEVEECVGDATDLPEQERSEGSIHANLTEIPDDQSQGAGKEIDQKIEKTTSCGQSPLSQLNMMHEVELEKDAGLLKAVSDGLDAASIFTAQEDKENKPSGGNLPGVVVEQQSAKYIVDARLIEDLCSSMENFKISEPRELNKIPPNSQIEQPREAENGDGTNPISVSQLQDLVLTIQQQEVERTARLRRLANRMIGGKQGEPSSMVNSKAVPEGEVLNSNSKAPDMGSNDGGKSQKELSEETIKNKQAEIVRLMDDIRRRQQNIGQRIQSVAQKMQLKKKGG